MDEIKEIIEYKPSPLMVKDDPRKGGKTIRLGYNTCYIVAGLLVTDGKVLLIQEAKRSCRGSWYLPAGRVEQNESLEEAVIREVKEESGFDFEPVSLIGIETNSYQWIRFTFTGRITGGKLKTPQEEDKESIQADWIPIDGLDSIQLRSMDCMNVIKLAETWYNEQGLKYTHLTIPASNELTTMRTIVLHRNNGQVNVLLRDVPTGNTKLPSCPLVSPSVRHDVDKLMNSSGCKGPCVTIGVYSIEHLVSGGDGIGFTLLIEAKEAGLRDGCGFHWETLSDQDLLDKINTLLDNKMSLIKLFGY